MTNQNNNVLDENSTRTSGSTALNSNIAAAIAVSEIVKTTLGPMGMDKMLIDSYGNSVITNDGVKILQEMDIEHPGAKLLVGVAKTQESEVGDGTTSAVILSGEFLNSAKDLVNKKIHPTAITRSFKIGLNKALSILDSESVTINPKNKKLVMDICSTAMTGKIAEFSKESLSEMIYDAIMKVVDNDKISINKIKIQKSVGGDISDSYLVDGIVLDKNPANVNMPEKINNAKILVCDFPLEVRELDNDAKLNIGSVNEYEQFLENEKNYLLNIVNKICEIGTNVVICQKGIDDNVAYHLAKQGILAIRRTRKSDIERLNLVTGKKVVNNLEDIESSNLGTVSKVTVKKILKENYIFLEGFESSSCVTLFLKGSTEHVLDELERAIDDSIGDVNSVLKSKKIVAGGGAIEFELVKQLMEFSKTFIGKEQLILEAYAKSFLVIPKVLCENSGFDEIDTISELTALHEQGKSKSGLNCFTGVCSDTLKVKIVEPINVKSQAIKSATEISSMILRIDDVIAAKQIREKLDSDM
jgi:thermosome